MAELSRKAILAKQYVLSVLPDAECVPRPGLNHVYRVQVHDHCIVTHATSEERAWIKAFIWVRSNANANN